MITGHNVCDHKFQALLIKAESIDRVDYLLQYDLLRSMVKLFECSQIHRV